MLAGHPEKIANEAGRRPIRHHDPPARTANPGKLPRNNLGAGREHRPEHADDDVESAVLIWQSLGVPFIKRDIDGLPRRTRSGCIE
jgi:hypothetical protein